MTSSFFTYFLLLPPPDTVLKVMHPMSLHDGMEPAQQGWVSRNQWFVDSYPRLVFINLDFSFINRCLFIAIMSSVTLEELSPIWPWQVTQSFKLYSMKWSFYLTLTLRSGHYKFNYFSQHHGVVGGDGEEGVLLAAISSFHGLNLKTCIWPQH